VDLSPDLRSRAIWAGVGLLWLTCVVLGLGMLAQYERAPGVAAEARAQWPADSQLSLDATRPTLVMLAHPRCTCTRASVAELAELMARTRRRPRGYVVFIKPGTMPGEWEHTELWQAAARIPDVTIVRDDGGVEAQRFGAETSGQTFLYDTSGRLMFSGGTTGARGHEGDNIGRATILALLNQEHTSRSRSFVFGCSLFASGDRPVLEESTSHARHRN
jgi:hypothetical protein